MPKGVYKRKPRPNKRAQILQAAAGVYAHYGFEGATIERMAEAAGVSKSLVGETFGGKQGLVRAIAEDAVQRALQDLNMLDETPGLTLPRREELIHAHIRESREQWCLILGTVLVPSFQFQQRDVLENMLEASAATVWAHRAELRTPTRQSARACAHTSQCLHMGYVMDGREEEYQAAMRQHLALYLQEKPQEETEA